ncbi:MAG: AIM24 family protein [Phycisphaerales bacterium]|nr:AIM24 family protein [Phycisphaerales bacterium]
MKIEHTILGNDMQAVEIEMQPGQEIVAEASTLLMMEDGITFDAKIGDGTSSGSGVMSALGRAVTGSGVFLTHFSNTASVTRKLSFTANNPGRIVPVHLPDWGGSINVEHSGFLCATKGTHLNAKRAKRIRAGIFGGSGFFLQTIQGDGMAFLHCCGSIIERELDDEVIRCEPGAVVAFDPSIEFSIERAGNLKTMLFGGDGVFLATLRGTGKVILQSLPWGRVVSHIVANTKK